jgi:hypothetical protein
MVVRIWSHGPTHITRGWAKRPSPFSFGAYINIKLKLNFHHIINKQYSMVYW